MTKSNSVRGRPCWVRNLREPSSLRFRCWYARRPPRRGRVSLLDSSFVHPHKRRAGTRQKITATIETIAGHLIVTHDHRFSLFLPATFCGRREGAKTRPRQGSGPAEPTKSDDNPPPPLTRLVLVSLHSIHRRAPSIDRAKRERSDGAKKERNDGRGPVRGPVLGAIIIEWLSRDEGSARRRRRRSGRGGNVSSSAPAARRRQSRRQRVSLFETTSSFPAAHVVPPAGPSSGGPRHRQVVEPVGGRRERQQRKRQRRRKRQHHPRSVARLCRRSAERSSGLPCHFPPHPPDSKGGGCSDRPVCLFHGIPGRPSQRPPRKRRPRNEHQQEQRPPGKR